MATEATSPRNSCKCLWPLKALLLIQCHQTYVSLKPPSPRNSFTCLWPLEAPLLRTTFSLRPLEALLLRKYQCYMVAFEAQLLRNTCVCLIVSRNTRPMLKITDQVWPDKAPGPTQTTGQVPSDRAPGPPPTTGQVWSDRAAGPTQTWM